MKIIALTIQGDTSAYTITANDAGLHCTCPAFRYARTTPPICKHIKFVQATLVQA